MFDVGCCLAIVGSQVALLSTLVNLAVKSLAAL